MKKTSEKRKTPRHGCYVPVEGKEGNDFCNSQTVDISKKGIGLISNRAISVDEKIAVEVVLDPNEDSVLVKGHVKWVRPLPDPDKYRVGMVFEDFFFGSPARLNKYFRK